jgi:hypothetical protein
VPQLAAPLASMMQHPPKTEQLWVLATNCPPTPHDAYTVDDAHPDCPGAHTPVHVPLTHVWFVHAAAFTQTPLALHVWGCVVVEHCVAPGAQLPVHDPLTHAWFEQAALFCQVPAGLHVCGCVLDEHCVWPGLHATHAPFRQTAEQAPPLSIQTPLAQVCGWSPAHRTELVVQPEPPDEDPPLDEPLPEPPELDPPDELPELEPPIATASRSPAAPSSCWAASRSITCGPSSVSPPASGFDVSTVTTSGAPSPPSGRSDSVNGAPPHPTKNATVRTIHFMILTSLFYRSTCVDDAVQLRSCRSPNTPRT